MPGDEIYYDGRVGNLYIRPITFKLQATFSSGVATKDTSLRISDPNATIAKDSTGDYDLAGMPTGTAYHVVGCTLDPAADDPADTIAMIALPRSMDASAGTGKVLFIRPDTGALADPADDTRLYLTIEIETGAPQS